MEGIITLKPSEEGDTGSIVFGRGYKTKLDKSITLFGYTFTINISKNIHN